MRRDFRCHAMQLTSHAIYYREGNKVGLMAEIIGGLFIGDEHTAMAPEVLDFGCVINATSEVPYSRFISSETITLRINVLDVNQGGEQDAMFIALFDACDIIHKSLMAGKKVLVHCAEAKQRSCAVVTAYLMFRGMGHLDALALVIRKHEQAFDYGDHFHFKAALAKWEGVLANNGQDTRSEHKDERVPIINSTEPEHPGRHRVV